MGVESRCNDLPRRLGSCSEYSGRWIIQTLDGTPDRNQSQEFSAAGGDVVNTDIDFR